ncbi:MAG: hypothetical protein AMXMBFR13_37350 [Phycisphaerae bacterium]
MPATYPVELVLTDRPVLVVGGGQVAARKVAGLLSAQAQVRVVSPEFTPELENRTDITREAREYTPVCLTGVHLVFACTDDPAVNAQIAADARKTGILCNVADAPDDCDFLVPAVLRRGLLTIAVGTGGTGPRLAALLRDRLESQFGPEFAILTEELVRARRIVQDRVSDPAVRRQILETLCTDCSLKLLTARDREAWRQWFERVTQARLAKTTPAVGQDAQAEECPEVHPEAP